MIEATGDSWMTGYVSRGDAEALLMVGGFAATILVVRMKPMVFTYVWLAHAIVAVWLQSDVAIGMAIVVGLCINIGWYSIQLHRQMVWDALLPYWVNSLGLDRSTVSLLCRLGDIMLHPVPLLYLIYHFNHTVKPHMAVAAFVLTRGYHVCVEGHFFGPGDKLNSIYAFDPPLPRAIFFTGYYYELLALSLVGQGAIEEPSLRLMTRMFTIAVGLTFLIQSSDWLIVHQWLAHPTIAQLCRRRKRSHIQQQQQHGEATTEDSDSRETDEQLLDAIRSSASRLLDRLPPKAAERLRVVLQSVMASGIAMRDKLILMNDINQAIAVLSSLPLPLAEVSDRMVLFARVSMHRLTNLINERKASFSLPSPPAFPPLPTFVSLSSVDFDRLRSAFTRRKKCMSRCTSFLSCLGEDDAAFASSMEQMWQEHISRSGD